MIKVEHLTKKYPGVYGNVNALNDVSFTLPDTGLIFILGKSGCGKTTLLNMLGGMDSPTSGDISLNGRSIVTQKESDLDAYRNNCVGFVFQEFNLLENYSVGSNVMLAEQLQGRKASRDDVDVILRQVQLTDSGGTLYDRSVRDLSGGQRQRVAIARALIKNPDIILADEPTGALDSETGSDLFSLLKKLSGRKLIIVASHDRESAEKYGDRVIELKDGAVISDRTGSGEYAPCSAAKGASEKDAAGKTGMFHLPLSRIVSMGLSGFRKKTVRLVISVILAVVSLTVFVFAASAMYADTLMSELKTAYSNGAATITINSTGSVSGREVFTDGDRVDYFNYDMASYEFSQKQVSLLESVSTIYPCIVNEISTSSRYVSKDDLSINQSLNPYLYFASNLMPCCLAIGSGFNAGDISLSPATQDSRLPENEDEIAITDYQADIFVRLGFKDYDVEGDEAQVRTVSDWNDMIGKSVLGRTIVGVYSTEESLDWFKQYDKDYDGEYSSNYSPAYYLDSYIYRWMQGDHMINTAIIYSDEDVADNYTSLIYRLSGSASKDRETIESLAYEEDTVEELGRGTSYSHYKYSSYVTTAYTGFEDAAWMFTKDTVQEACLIVGIVLAVFSALLLMNFLLASTEDRKRDIGILRSLGATKADTIGVYAAQSMMVALLDFILAVICGAIACAVINSLFNIALFALQPLPVLYLFLLCFGSIILATLLPAICIAKKKPVDIIRQA